MNEYLSSYGQGEERRGKLIKRSILAVLGIAILGSLVFFYFRTWSEERTISAFLTKLKDKDYKAAYATWGCTDSTPCKYYPLEKFMEDWGPQSTQVDPASAKVDDAEVCGDFVIVTVASAKGSPVQLNVSKSGDVGFAPICSGRRWRFKAFFKRILGG